MDAETRTALDALRRLVETATDKQPMMARLESLQLVNLIESKLSPTGCPPDTLEAIDAYVTNRVAPSGFLGAVLSNDLKQACERADETNRSALFWIVSYLYNHAPSVCWGSEERVDAWLNEGEPS